jgi:hypothetical protein
MEDDSCVCVVREFSFWEAIFYVCMGVEFCWLLFKMAGVF